MWAGFDAEDLHTLVFEVFDKKVCLGEVRVSLTKAPKDSLVDAWLQLKPSSEGKKKGGPDSVPGVVHVRYILSVLRETRPKQADMVPQEFFYRKNKIEFKPGDLIAFSVSWR